MSLRLIAYFLSLVVSTGFARHSMAEEIRIAVASNFATTMKILSHRFETDTGHKVTLIFGATGRHFAQIINGAPFDAFFAADSKRPQLLEQNGLIQSESRFTYAFGRLVLWSPRPDYVDPQGKILQSGDFLHLAIANPKLAPYGRAARQVLKKSDLWQLLFPRLVRGENVSQAFQFVSSRNAELGFVAYSQIRAAAGSFWQPPQNAYDPIKQQAVLLKANDTASAFLAFVKSRTGRLIIKSAGYGVPDA